MDKTRIFKFDLQIENVQEIMIHKGAKLLSVQMQNGVLRVWAECLETAKMSTRRFAIVGTGMTVPKANEKQYLATVQDGALVWHVYEIL